jgi:hypothetical protein
VTIRSLVIAGLALLVAAPSGLGATRQLTVPLPKPGQITLTGLFFKATPRAGTPVATFRPPLPTVRLANRAALTPDLQDDLVVVTRVARVPRTRARFALMVAVVRRAGPGAAVRSLLDEPTNAVISYSSPSIAGFTLGERVNVPNGVRPGDCDDPLSGAQLRYAGEFGGFRLAAAAGYGELFNDPSTRAGPAADTLENAMKAHADCPGAFLDFIRPPAPAPTFSCTGTKTPFPNDPAEGIFAWNCTAGIARIVITPPAGNPITAFFSAAGNANCVLGATLACDVTGAPLMAELNVRFASPPPAGTPIATDITSIDALVGGAVIPF